MALFIDICALIAFLVVMFLTLETFLMPLLEKSDHDDNKGIKKQNQKCACGHMEHRENAKFCADCGGKLEQKGQGKISSGKVDVVA